MKLKEWREDVGRSAADIAEELGVTRQAVQKYETGSLPQRLVLEDIVRMTGGEVTPNDWFDFAELAPFVAAQFYEAGMALRWVPQAFERTLARAA